MAASFREKHLDLNIAILETKYQGHATELCLESGPELDLIILVGGDGTLNECVTGLMKLNQPERPSLLVFALGSGNDFVKSHKSPKSVEELYKAILDSKSRMVDVGEIQYKNSTDYFINIADAGMGAEVVKKVNVSPSWMGTRMKFSTAILRTFSSYKNVMISCNWENGEWKGLARAIILANGKYFANGLCIGPDAEIDDGLFDLIILGDLSLADYIKYLPKIKRGEHIEHPEVHYHKVSSISINGNSSMEMDGELGKELPAKIEVVPKAIRFLFG